MYNNQNDVCFLVPEEGTAQHNKRMNFAILSASAHFFFFPSLFPFVCVIVELYRNKEALILLDFPSKYLNESVAS